MKLFRYTFAALALFGLGLTCASAAAPTTLTVDLKPLNGSGESGTATITQDDSGVKIVVTLKGAPAAAQPTHIHAGTCDKINAAPEWPLESLVNGTSTSEVKGVTIDTLLSKPYAINVHKSTSDLGTYVACGDIKAS